MTDPLNDAANSLNKRSKHAIQKQTNPNEEPVVKKSREERYERIMREIEESRKNMPKTAGRIVEIEMFNFMCHSKFKAHFDVEKNNCFYILGPNGSGKSALFAALNIGLGGRSKQMERGNSLKGYIKEGRNSARIRITLTNEGFGSVEGYDKYIVVQRTINQSASTFQILSKNEQGQETLVSRKASDLAKILQCLSIELDNPLAWLSQDRSRRFLAEADPNKFYEIFMKTTELENVSDLYAEINRLTDQIRTRLEDCCKEIDVMKKEVEDKQIRFNALMNIAVKRKELSHLQWMMLYSPIRDLLTKIELYELEVAKNEEKKGEISSKVDTIQEKKSEIERNIQKCQTDLKMLNDQVQKMIKANPLDHEKRELEREMQEIRREVNRKKDEKMMIDREIESNKKQLVNIMGDANRDFEAEKSHIHDLQANTKSRINEFNYERSQIERERQAKDHEKSRIQNEINSLDDQISRCTRQINQIQADQRDFDAIRKNQVARFGRDAPKTLEVIEAHWNGQYGNSKIGRFQHKPIGPLGMYVNVRDPRWAPAVESIIGKSFEMYIVNSGHDRKILEALLRHHRLTIPEILVTRFSNERFDTSKGEPAGNFLTMARALEISESTVYNVLVDTLNIEALLLIENDDQVRYLMRDSPPQNAKMAITLSRAQVFPQNDKSTYRFYADNRNRPLRYLVDAQALAPRDFEAEVASVQAQKQELEFKKAGKLRHKKEIEAEIKEIQKAIHEKKKEVHENQKEIEKLEQDKAKIDDLMMRIGSIQAIKDDITKRKEDLIRVNKDLEEIDQRKTEMMRKQKVWEGKHTEHVQELELKRREILHLSNNINIKKDELASVENDLKRIQSSIAKFDLKITQNKDAINDLETQRHDLIQKAESEQGQYEKPSDFDHPLDLEKLPASSVIKEEFKRLSKEIQIAETQLQNSQEPITLEALDKAKQAYHKFCREYAIYHGVFKILYQAVKIRDAKVQTLKLLIPQQLAQKFKQHMRIRNYEGTLQVDHEKRQINIRVAVDHHQEGASTSQPVQRPNEQGCQRKTTNKRNLQDLKGLSGGERSYATACFVMSLWEVMDSPFRCLDEFDVYMDMLNRRVIMEMLVDMGSRETHRQFFFFTPQGITGLSSKHNMQVFEMPKIDRNASAEEVGEFDDIMEEDLVN